MQIPVICRAAPGTVVARVQKGFTGLCVLIVWAVAFTVAGTSVKDPGAL